MLGPLQNLILDMSLFMLTIDPDFEISPAVGKTISRIYRDTRFSRDKSPYRSTIYSKQQKFVVEGKKHKKILDKSKLEEIQNWYQRTNLYLVCNRNIDDRLFRGGLVYDLMSGFELIVPFYHFLWKLK